jgi:hypothetical protein
MYVYTLACGEDVIARGVFAYAGWIVHKNVPRKVNLGD